jgi:hypothetical protein
MSEQVISEQNAHTAKGQVGVQTKQWRFSGRLRTAPLLSRS